MFQGERLFLNKSGWNTVVLRLKLNSFDECDYANPDGAVALGVNGRAAWCTGIVWAPRRGEAIRRLLFACRFAEPGSSRQQHMCFKRVAVVS